MQLNITWVPRDANVIAGLQATPFLRTSAGNGGHSRLTGSPVTRTPKPKDCEAVDAFTHDWGR